MGMLLPLEHANVIAEGFADVDDPATLAIQPHAQAVFFVAVRARDLTPPVHPAVRLVWLLPDY